MRGGYSSSARRPKQCQSIFGEWECPWHRIGFIADHDALFGESRGQIFQEARLLQSLRIKRSTTTRSYPVFPREIRYIQSTRLRCLLLIQVCIGSRTYQYITSVEFGLVQNHTGPCSARNGCSWSLIPPLSGLLTFNKITALRDDTVVMVSSNGTIEVNCVAG